MAQTKKSFITFALVFLVYFMFSALPSGMLTPFLTSLGYSTRDIGILFSLGAISGIALSTLIGKIADQTRKIKPFFIVGLILSIGTIALLFMSVSATLLCFLAGVAATTLSRVLSGLIDSWALETDETIRLHYGSIRAFGSIGFAIGLGVLGRFVDRYGFSAIIPVTFILGSLVLVLILGLRDVQPIAQKHEKVQLKALFTPVYTGWVIVFFFVFFVIGVEDMTITIKMLDLGAKPSEIALYYSAQALFELPLFFMGGKLIKRFGALKLLLVAIIALSTKMFLFATFASISTFLMLTFIQFFSFPLVMITSKNILYDASPMTMKISGQMVGLSIYAHLSGILAPLLIGSLIDFTNATTSLYALSILLGIPFILTLVIGFRRRKQRNQPDNIPLS